MMRILTARHETVAHAGKIALPFAIVLLMLWVALLMLF
jgi:hypothetical protein